RGDLWCVLRTTHPRKNTRHHTEPPSPRLTLARAMVKKTKRIPAAPAEAAQAGPA
ncbi:unnamed protein product, partial [Scytosiphon promiscuus]